MKKIYILVIYLFGTVAGLYAQTNVQTVLDKMAAKIKAAKTVSTSFTLSQYDKSNRVTGSSKGLVKIKDKKYYLKEETTEIFCDGNKTWNLDGNEVIISNATDTDDDDNITPQQVLSGFNQKDFTANLVSTDATNYQVSLTPIDKRKNFKQIILFINKSTNLVSKARITDKVNNITTISFSAITLDATIPDSQFVFDASKHPGVEVINQ